MVCSISNSTNLKAIATYIATKAIQFNIINIHYVIKHAQNGLTSENFNYQVKLNSYTLDANTIGPANVSWTRAIKFDICPQNGKIKKSWIFQF